MPDTNPYGETLLANWPPVEIKEIERDHTLRLEEAQRLSVTDLCAHHERSVASKGAAVDGSMDELMTRPDLIASFRRASCKRRRLPGLTNSPMAFFRWHRGQPRNMRTRL